MILVLEEKVKGRWPKPKEVPMFDILALLLQMIFEIDQILLQGPHRFHYHP